LYKPTGASFVGATNPLVAYWYFHLPNFILAALMYTLLGRAILGLAIDHDSQNYIWRFFCRITDPVVRVVAIVTPKAAAPIVLWLLAFVWLFWLRVAFYALFAVSGVSPRAG
jgi:YggT family protein